MFDLDTISLADFHQLCVECKGHPHSIAKKFGQGDARVIIRRTAEIFYQSDRLTVKALSQCSVEDLQSEFQDAYYKPLPKAKPAALESYPFSEIHRLVKEGPSSVKVAAMLGASGSNLGYYLSRFTLEGQSLSYTMLRATSAQKFIKHWGLERYNEPLVNKEGLEDLLYVNLRWAINKSTTMDEAALDLLKHSGIKVTGLQLYKHIQQLVKTYPRAEELLAKISAEDLSISGPEANSIADEGPSIKKQCPKPLKRKSKQASSTDNEEQIKRSRTTSVSETTASGHPFRLLSSDIDTAVDLDPAIDLDQMDYFSLERFAVSGFPDLSLDSSLRPINDVSSEYPGRFFLPVDNRVESALTDDQDLNDFGNEFDKFIESLSTSF